MKRSPIRKQSKKRAAKYTGASGRANMAYMQAVKQLPCVVCGARPCDAHHCFHGRYSGAKASDFDVIPLCKWHHQDGPEAIHRIKRTWAEKHGPDHSYINQTRHNVAALTEE